LKNVIASIERNKREMDKQNTQTTRPNTPQIECVATPDVVSIVEAEDEGDAVDVIDIDSPTPSTSAAVGCRNSLLKADLAGKRRPLGEEVCALEETVVASATKRDVRAFSLEPWTRTTTTSSPACPQCSVHRPQSAQGTRWDKFEKEHFVPHAKKFPEWRSLLVLYRGERGHHRRAS